MGRVEGRPIFRDLGEFIESACYFFEYETVIKAGMHGYKFEGENAWRHVFLRLLFGAIPSCPFPDVRWWIPVPAHPTRIKKRGFDPVVALFSPLLNSWGYGLTPIVDRVKETPSLFHLSKPERQTVLQGAFAVNPTFLAEIQGERVVILDDILTSGSTVMSLASTLKQCGVGRIDVLTFLGVSAINDSD